MLASCKGKARDQVTSVKLTTLEANKKACPKEQA